MTFDEARERAEKTSKKFKCDSHVNGRIRCVLHRDGSLEPIADPQGWEASDWYVGGSTALWVDARGEEHLT